MQHRSLLASVAAPAIAVVVAIAACGGAVEQGDLYESGLSSGSSGVTPTPTAQPTVGPSPTAAPTAPKTPAPKPCTVSFRQDVMQVFEDNKCSSVTCHGGVLNRPRIDTNANNTYQAITTYKLGTGQAYVVVGGTDPKASGMYCNLRGDCGTRMPPGAKLQSSDLETIDEWLACGAPLN